MNRITNVILLIAGLAWASPANAETAADFLKSLEGNYSGRGTAIVIGNKPQRIACKISNVYDANDTVLNVSGECAGTKGKSKINGGVSVLNDHLKGSFLSPRKGMVVTQSAGSLEGDKMQLSTSMVDENVGRLVKIRQVISKTDEGINAKFYTYNNSSKTYEPTGEIKLNKTKAESSE